MNLDAELTIAELVTYFDGALKYRTIDGWVRRGLVTPTGRDRDGRILIRLGDALQAERRTWRQPRGRPRCVAA